MAELLSKLLAAGLIENLDGDDTLFAKMEKAAKDLAKSMGEDPQLLIRAVLAGLDPDIPADDPAIARAEKALVAKWKTVRSVYPDTPVGLLRAILLDACDQAAEADDKAAAIVWWTAADTVPLIRLGREEEALREILQRLAEKTEVMALAIPDQPKAKPSAKLTLASPSWPEPVSPLEWDRVKLRELVAATVGPQAREGKALTNPNPRWPSAHQSNHWAWDFADRMSVLLADLTEKVAYDLAIHQNKLGQTVETSQAAIIKAVKDAWAKQQAWVRSALDANAARSRAEELRLRCLWWSEALYSPTLRRSYRELDPSLAYVVMAMDLADTLDAMPPASVGHLLAETVHRLPEASYDHKRTLSEILTALHASRAELPNTWPKRLELPPHTGRLSLRDLLVACLRDPAWDLEQTMARAGIPADVTFSLPELSRALFRQEQAVRLAGGTP